MDRWEVSEGDLSGYWNPPPPSTASNSSSSSGTISISSQVTLVMEESNERPPLPGCWRRDAEPKRQKICEDESSEGSDDIEILQPPPPPNVETVDLENSNEEEEDYDVCIRKKLASQDPKKDSQEPQSTADPGPSTSAKKQVPAQDRDRRYETKFIKLRHFYDKMKKDLAKEKEFSSSEISRLNGKVTQQSLEITRLQTKVERKDALLLLLQEKINSLEKDLESSRAKGAVANDAAVQENLMLKEKNKQLLNAMNAVVYNQISAFNANRTMMESTYQAYENANHGMENLMTPASPTASTSRSEEVAGSQQESSDDSSEIEIMQAPKTRGEGPTDPRRIFYDNPRDPRVPWGEEEEGPTDPRLRFT